MNPTINKQKELCRIHESGDHSISDLAELFSVSRPTMYRTLQRHLGSAQGQAL